MSKFDSNKYKDMIFENIEEIMDLALDGDALSQYYLGVYYASSESEDYDLKKAFNWFYKSAQQGFVSAQCNVGVCYANGIGVDQDYSKAIYWFVEAAKQNDETSIYNLGLSYFNGNGVVQNYEKAIYWYQRQWNLVTNMRSLF